jgi:hypothetical protein
MPTKFELNGVQLTLDILPFESNGQGGWHNATVTTPDGQTIHVGGGWVHSAESASHDNRCSGLAVDACPQVYWPGAVREGDFEAYDAADIGDIDGLMQAVGLSSGERQQAVSAVQDASREAFLSRD